MGDDFWLSDVQWAAIEQHVPKVYTGKRRVDDRRVISGIAPAARRLPMAGAARGLWAVHDGVQPLQPLEQARAVAGDPRGAGGEQRAAGHRDDRQLVDQGAPIRLGRAKRGERFQAIGRSPGGRTTKLHLLVDEHGRPHVLHLTAGQASDIVAAAELIARSRPSARLLADRAYDGDALGHSLARRGTLAVIPNKINRVNRLPFDPQAYKLRNAIERAFCRLHDFQAIATRYDTLARNFLAGICIAATLSFWIK